MKTEKTCTWCGKPAAVETKEQFNKTVFLCPDCLETIRNGQSIRCSRCGAYSNTGNNWNRPYCGDDKHPMGSCEHCCDIPDGTTGIVPPPQQCKYCGQAEGTTYKAGVRLYNGICENCQKECFNEAYENL